MVAAARAEFSRRVPVAVIRSAPPAGGQALVNAEVVFWLDTDRAG